MIKNLIVGSRSSGKTEWLLKMAHGTNAIIVCHNQRTADDLKDRAKHAGLNIKDPVSIDKVVDTNWRPKERDTEFLFDNVDLILEHLARGIPIKAITISRLTNDVICTSLA